jgi:hypothetical protein
MPVVNMLPAPGGGTSTAAARTAATNPPFDPRISNIPLQQYSLTGGTSKLYRGYITDDTPARTKGQFYRLNFLYNPSVLTEQRSIDTTNAGISPLYSRADDPTVSPLLPLNSSINFDLLFDRTFELWDMSYHGTSVGSTGVMADMDILYGLVGIKAPANSANPTTPSVTIPNPGGTTFNVDNLTGVMQYSPVYAYFGSAWASSYNNLKYYGYITSISITITHWSQDMIPMRCGVSISMTLLPSIIKTSASTTTADTTANPTGKTPAGPTTSGGKASGEFQR